MWEYQNSLDMKQRNAPEGEGGQKRARNTEEGAKEDAAPRDEDKDLSGSDWCTLPSQQCLSWWEDLNKHLKIRLETELWLPNAMSL